MRCVYSEEDIKNVNGIKDFLDKHEVEYTTKYDNFCIENAKGEYGKRYEIEYIPSVQFPIAYPKYGIDGVDKDFFYKLSIDAEKNNSFKLWIKDFEWRNDRQREVLKSYILHAVGKTPFSWYARDCKVKEVATKEGRAFEEEHCFYGRRGASLSLGLYSKKERNGVPADTLLMLYTFGKNFFGKKEGLIEVIRVGTMKFSHVTGGSSKLLKYFLNNYKTIQIGKNSVDVKQVIFYSDFDHNSGSSMAGVGFEFDSYSGGGFMNYWIEEGIAKQREPMRHKWVMEQMRLGKVIAIPNAGIKRFVYNTEVN